MLSALAAGRLAAAMAAVASLKLASPIACPSTSAGPHRWPCMATLWTRAHESAVRVSQPLFYSCAASARSGMQEHMTQDTAHSTQPQNCEGFAL